MLEPIHETWFMEGRLKAVEYYVQLGPDFHDLEEKIIYDERHPDEAREIVRNANSFVGQLRDEPSKQVISPLVMYKYFVATRQIEPDESIAGLIWP